MSNKMHTQNNGYYMKNVFYVKTVWHRTSFSRSVFSMSNNPLNKRGQVSLLEVV